jgi:hypothetical protein
LGAPNKVGDDVLILINPSAAAVYRYQTVYDCAPKPHEGPGSPGLRVASVLSPLTVYGTAGIGVAFSIKSLLGGDADADPATETPARVPAATTRVAATERQNECLFTVPPVE